MSNGAILEEIHELGEPPDDTELALDTIPDLLDKIEQDLKSVAVQKASYTRITSRLEALRDQPRLAAEPNDIAVLLRTLHDVDSQLFTINQLTAFQRLSRRKHIASVLEDIALLLDDALAGILYGSEFKALEGDHERVNLDNSGQIFVPPTPEVGSIPSEEVPPPILSGMGFASELSLSRFPEPPTRPVIRNDVRNIVDPNARYSLRSSQYSPRRSWRRATIASFDDSLRSVRASRTSWWRFKPLPRLPSMVSSAADADSPDRSWYQAGGRTHYRRSRSRSPSRSRAHGSATHETPMIMRRRRDRSRSHSRSRSRTYVRSHRIFEQRSGTHSPTSSEDSLARRRRSPGSIIDTTTDPKTAWAPYSPPVRGRPRVGRSRSPTPERGRRRIWSGERRDPTSFHHRDERRRSISRSPVRVQAGWDVDNIAITLLDEAPPSLSRVQETERGRSRSRSRSRIRIIHPGAQLVAADESQSRSRSRSPILARTEAVYERYTAEARSRSPSPGGVARLEATPIRVLPSDGPRTVARGLDTIRIGDRNRMGRGRSASPSDGLRDAARATPPIVVTADALAPPMSPATSMYHTATPNVSASGLGRSGDLGSAGASLGAIQSSINASKAALPGVMRGVTHFTIEELCEEIRSTPELSNAPIGDLYRREIPSGVQHEFILVRSVVQGRPSTWIRIDRAAKGYRERWRITSRYPADDTARIGQDGHHRLMVGESRLRAHVVFKHPPNRPKFLTLADLVTILHEESRDYRLLSENCYFFTSVIQELLTDLHGGEVVSGALGHRKLGAVVRRRVRKRFATMATAFLGNGAALSEPAAKARAVPVQPNPTRRRGFIGLLSRTLSRIFKRKKRMSQQTYRGQ